MNLPRGNLLRIFVSIAVVVLFLSPSLVFRSTAQQGKTIVIDNMFGRPYPESAGPPLDLGSLVGNLTQRGATVKVANGGINSTILSGADALLLPKIFKPGVNYTTAEIGAIKDWFNTGKKFLWVGSDSDYHEGLKTGRDFTDDQANQVLAAVGSRLRVDTASVEDPVVNAGGAAYRVVGNFTNTANADAAKIVAGVKAVRFHGPTHVIGVDSTGKYVAFDQIKDHVFWIIKTSPYAKIVDNSPQVPPKVFSVGAKASETALGGFVLAAGEKFAGQARNSKIIVTSEAMYGRYSSWVTSERGVSFEGPTFVLNAISWGLQVEEPPVDYTLYAIVAVVVIVVIVAAALLLRRKGKAPT